MTLVLGIDPGLGGALALYDPDSFGVFVVDMPTHALVRNGKAKREIDVQGVLAFLRQYKPAHAFIEQVGAMRGQGVSSVFAFGKGYGIVICAVAACGIPSTFVHPRVWKKALGVPAAKDGARARASQLMPAFADLWPLKKDEGKAEAALIALWGARQLGGIAKAAE